MPEEELREAQVPFGDNESERSVALAGNAMALFEFEAANVSAHRAGRAEDVERPYLQIVHPERFGEHS